MHSWRPDRHFRTRPLPLLLAALLTASLWMRADTLRAADGTQASAAPDTATLDSVTIEAARQKRELRRRVDHYVASNVVTYLHDSLVRWNTPVCPLAAGLPRNMEEFILERISQIARAANVPLAGESCRANLFIIASAYPDLLLKKWRARNPRMYNLCNGMGGVQTFLHSRRPIRVWYNTELGSKEAVASSPDTAGLPFFSPFAGCTPAFSGGGSIGTRLSFSAVQHFSSVFIIVDLNQMKSLTIGQLADYVSLLGLAQIDPEGDTAHVPTILTLFHNRDHPPQALSLWDRALLHSLYNTSQSNVLEVSMIERSMVSQIAPAR